MNGLSGNDVLNGLAGSDTLVGGEGDDTFVFAPGSGQDVISDFTPGQGTDDVIDVAAFDFSDFEAVKSRSSDSGIGTVIDLGNGDRVTLTGVQVSQLYHEDFIL
jgi:Ca2+-binding RTX toxin-like protein